MILGVRLVKGHKTLYRHNVADTCEPSAGFRDRLENCLLALCKEADVPVPIWLSRNSTELARFKKTNFFADQFTETVAFERFELTIVEI